MNLKGLRDLMILRNDKSILIVRSSTEKITMIKSNLDQLSLR